MISEEDLITILCVFNVGWKYATRQEKVACDKSSFSMSAIIPYLERHKKQEVEADSLAISKQLLYLLMRSKFLQTDTWQR